MVEVIPFERELRIKEGDDALIFGDFSKSEQIFAEASQVKDNPELQAVGTYGLALTYMKSDKEALALTILEALTKDFPESLPAKRAYFLIGEIYSRLGRDAEALEAYFTYLNLRPGVIDVYLQEKIGDLYVRQSNYTAAIQAFQTAFLTADPGTEGNLSIKIASAHDSLGKDDLAISLYQDIFYNTESNQTKAQMDLAIGRIHYSNGDFEKAYAYFQDAVNNYPSTYDAYSALVTLVNDNVTVDEFQRGLINYNMGQPDLAIEAFDRYMQNPQANMPAALYYKGLATRTEGLETASLYSNERFEANKSGGTKADQDAVALLNKVLNEYPNSSYYNSAVEELANTYYAFMDNPKKAAEVAINFVASVPASVKASSMLFIAGRYYELAGMIREAADTWVRLGTEYPSSSETFQGLFFGGMLYYRLKEWDFAQAAFNKALLLSQNSLETAGAHLWRGIIYRKVRDPKAANEAFLAASASDPHGYYGLRAQELLDGKEPFSPPAEINFNVNLENEIILAKAWLRVNFSLPTNTDLDSLDEIALDPHYKRGYEFWALGLYPEGRTEFEVLRSTYQQDAAKTFPLIRELINLGYNSLAITASRRLIKLSGLDEFNQDVPKYFRMVIYGTYFQKWILEMAEGYEVDPLLLFSLILQESQFEGYLSSSAGARGLMQVVPATGAQIAGEINFPENFEASDLDIPDISLTLGTNYLRRQIIAFDGDLYAALAAYNSGPGNARIWKDIAGEDKDLFVGTVRFLETRTYIRVIVENYAQYKQLYGSN